MTISPLVPVPATSTSMAIMSPVATSSVAALMTGGVAAVYEQFSLASIVIAVESMSTESVTFRI